MTVLITFACLKGGVSKTTHAAALTAGILDLGKTVRFIETDEQGSGGAWADEVAELSPSLDSVYLKTKGCDFEQVQDLISQQADDTDFAILDSPGSASPALMPALYLSDVVLVPFKLQEMDVEGLKRTKLAYDLIFERFKEDNPNALVALHRPGRSFISNVERTQLVNLGNNFAIRSGLPDSPALHKWFSNYRTPKQLRSGETNPAAPEQLTAANLAKAEDHITKLTETVLELVKNA